MLYDNEPQVYDLSKGTKLYAVAMAFKIFPVPDELAVRRRDMPAVEDCN